MIVSMGPRARNHIRARTHTHAQVHQLYDSITPRRPVAAVPASVPSAGTVRSAATDARMVIGDEILHALAAAHRASSQKRPKNRPIKEQKRHTNRASRSATGRGLQRWGSARLVVGGHKIAGVPYLLLPAGGG